MAPHLVREFIDGTHIKWIGQNSPVPPRCSWGIRAGAERLEHLHSMGLIHATSPREHQLSQDHHRKLLVKVIDFGIAKQLAEGEGGQGLTQTGMFLGKLKYASPEQAGFLKDGEYLDPRSDLYSFGIVMYEMLAGKAPFNATNPHGYILKHVTEKPLPIHELNPEVRVPAQLESIIMRSLEKQREARYATAGEFAHALEAVRNTIPPDQVRPRDRMITLSGQQTWPAGFQTGAFTQPGGTQTGTQPGGTQAAPRPVVPTFTRHRVAAKGDGDGTRLTQGALSAPADEVERKAPSAATTQPSWKFGARQLTGRGTHRRRAQVGRRCSRRADRDRAAVLAGRDWPKKNNTAMVP